MAKGGKRKSAAVDTAEETNRSERKTRRQKSVAEPEPEEDVDAELADEEGAEEQLAAAMAPTKMKAKRNDADSDSTFVGDPIPPEEAAQRWPKRYQSKKSILPRETEADFEEDEYVQAKRHYSQAMVDEVLYNLNDNVHVKADDDQPDYIARVIEFFEGADGERYFSAQWFYRAEDTPIKNLADHSKMFDKRRVFLSEVKNINPLDCIVSKLKIARVSPNLDLEEKEKPIPECDFYYDMKYLVPHLTFASMDTDSSRLDSDASTISSESGSCNAADDATTACDGDIFRTVSSRKSEMTLLDLYSGCGGMSTGLCIGARRSGVNLVTRWAVDKNSLACESLKLNHPETEVRNEAADDFLCLLKEWEKLVRELEEFDSNMGVVDASNDDESNDDDDGPIPSEVYEVERLLDVVYGDPNNVKKPGLYFQVRWKGYDSDEDTWEPTEGLSDCKEKLMNFVREGQKNKILPLPGDVDFICGGPPCQGVSGFNRFRNREDPLADTKNRQLLVYMDIIHYLKPRFILMENVVDILKFKDAFLGRYALGRLVSMNYQARIGMMPAGAYGVPQFRMRVFLWGAHPSERLPQFPLPTHEVVNRGVVPKEFEEILVDYDNKKARVLEDALFLQDAVSDLPPVENNESRDEMPYDGESRTKFQKYIRLKRDEVIGLDVSTSTSLKSGVLYDHRPLKLNDDDLERVQNVPKKKGANFRDLPGVLVNANNIVSLDPSIERPTVASGKPLVPDYAITFVGGRSTKPFARLWWDEIIATVVTRAEPHNQAIIHPEQDRVMTVRELARFQGFPDFYKFSGPIKERYIQIGNAVAVPVGIALGYTLGQACQGLCGDNPLTKLPFKFPDCLALDDNLSTKE
ncbi:hypothetical protein TIFTF001_011048 [Ficus carica]|uniref:DNA (cytosine-5-)-methyltransferase n=1 Tax=Ficus carica TaxID=3494 RepID=A0AA87ZZ82_FICCA|nr:hypothetical protein TIFTF001_011048 [Ficus carica]